MRDVYPAEACCTEWAAAAMHLARRFSRWIPPLPPSRTPRENAKPKTREDDMLLHQRWKDREGSPWRRTRRKACSRMRTIVLLRIRAWVCGAVNTRFPPPCGENVRPHGHAPTPAPPYHCPPARAGCRNQTSPRVHPAGTCATDLCTRAHGPIFLVEPVCDRSGREGVREMAGRLFAETPSTGRRARMASREPSTVRTVICHGCLSETDMGVRVRDWDGGGTDAVPPARRAPCISHALPAPRTLHARHRRVTGMQMMGCKHGKRGGLREMIHAEARTCPNYVLC